ncbi:MAG: hypothetical protein JW760_08750 [Spirochaetales bacterium]|nr:hypothetical protein [Spirochaetales bacterium]
MKTSKQLTLFEAAGIVAGYGIGGGVMAVPFLAARTGIFPAIGIILVCYAASALLHLMIAEMSSASEGKQILEIMTNYLFRGRLGGVLTWVFFALILFAFLASLGAYIAGAGEILTELTGLHPLLCQLLFYLIAAGIVAFGLKVLGVSEKIAIIMIALVFAVLAVASFKAGLHPFPPAGGGFTETLALFGMVMFCFAAFFSVPQAAEGLAWNRKLTGRAVLLGIGINLVFILVVTLLTLSVSEEVTRVAIIGWASAIGAWAGILGSVIVFLAMLTSYWSISYALATILKERLKWKHLVCWLAATVPTLLFVMSGMTDFLGFMRLAGGAIAIIVALLVVPTFRKFRAAVLPGEHWSMGPWGATAFQVIVIIAYILMAAGSFVEI